MASYIPRHCPAGEVIAGGIVVIAILCAGAFAHTASIVPSIVGVLVANAMVGTEHDAKVFCCKQKKQNEMHARMISIFFFTVNII